MVFTTVLVICTLKCRERWFNSAFPFCAAAGLVGKASTKKKPCRSRSQRSSRPPRWLSGKSVPLPARFCILAGVLLNFWSSGALSCCPDLTRFCHDTNSSRRVVLACLAHSRLPGLWDVLSMYLPSGLFSPNTYDLSLI